ncbi:MAG: hypothetical protein Q8928_16155 [Bacteroidota bacterium]|nr:hypothetical protein [Bacteroidota bacterium]
MLCFVFFLSDAYAADKKNIALKTDSSIITALKVPSSKIAKYQNLKEFNYRTTEPVNSGFWDMLKAKLVKLLEKISESKISQIGFYVLFIGIFIILIISFIGVDVQTLFMRNKTSQDLASIYEQESIEETDFETAINSEISQENYNRAVRFLYLKLLRELTRKNLINWQKEKVNHDYFKEMIGSTHFTDFKNITQTYEYVWYGKFPLKQPDFDVINSRFSQLFNKLNA